MITIIKQGNLKGYEVTCKRCGCIFRFMNSDVEIVTNSPVDSMVKIRCPYCDCHLTGWSIESLVNYYS